MRISYIKLDILSDFQAEIPTISSTSRPLIDEILSVEYISKSFKEKRVAIHRIHGHCGVHGNKKMQKLSQYYSVKMLENVLKIT